MRKFDVLYADPPWAMGYVKGGKVQGTVKGGEVLPYPTMTDIEIMSLPIPI